MSWSIHKSSARLDGMFSRQDFIYDEMRDI